MKYDLEELAARASLAKADVEMKNSSAQSRQALHDANVAETKAKWPEYKALFEAAIDKLNLKLADSGFSLSADYIAGGDKARLMSVIFKTVTVDCKFSPANRTKQMVILISEAGILEVDLSGKGMKPAFDDVKTRFELKSAEPALFEDILSALVAETIA